MIRKIIKHFAKKQNFAEKQLVTKNDIFSVSFKCGHYTIDYKLVNVNDSFAVETCAGDASFVTSCNSLSDAISIMSSYVDTTLRSTLYLERLNNGKF